MEGPLVGLIGGGVVLGFDPGPRQLLSVLDHVVWKETTRMAQTELQQSLNTSSFPTDQELYIPLSINSLFSLVDFYMSHLRVDHKRGTI